MIRAGFFRTTKSTFRPLFQKVIEIQAVLVPFWLEVAFAPIENLPAKLLHSGASFSSSPNFAAMMPGGLPFFGGYPGSAQALLATAGAIGSGLLSQSGGFVPPLLPVAPTGPAVLPPFVAMARGGGGPPAAVEALPATVGGIVTQTSTFGFQQFCEKLGAVEETTLSSFCLLSEIDLEGALDATVLDEDGTPLTPLQRAALVDLVRRIFAQCGYAVPALGCKLPEPKSKQPQTDTPGQSEQRADSQTEQTVALADTVDQAARGTAKLISFSELAECRAEFLRITGDHPTEEQTPSAEQLSGLKALLGTGRVPYTDFSVWGPYGSRLARFRRTDAAVFVGGELVQKRIEGPNTFDSWQASWDIFAVAMISLKAAKLGTLNRYKAGMVQLHKLFPRMWSVLQTTDVILRTERWGRLREQIEANVVLGAPPPGYDYNAPWDLVISQSTYGREGLNAAWWQSHFVLPCTLGASATAATHTIRDIEGLPSSSSGSADSWAKPPPAPKNPKAPTARNTGDKEVCSNFNSRSGRCGRDEATACWAGRLHICDVCGGHHRGSDVHTGPGEKYQKAGAKRWNKNQGGKDSKKGKWGKA